MYNSLFGTVRDSISGEESNVLSVVKLVVVFYSVVSLVLVVLKAGFGF